MRRRLTTPLTTNERRPVHRFLTILVTLALALAPTPPQMSAPSDATAARRPLQRLSVALSSDLTWAQRGDTITYTLRATNTGRQSIGAFNLVMDPPPNFLPGDESCGPVPGRPDFPTPDGLWCEYGWELAPGASVTMTLGVQISQVDGYNPPVWAMVGCATMLPRGGGAPPPPTSAASALAVSGFGVRHDSRAAWSH
jgi:uncharacterized repeat protein (TIGR01451 family)